MRPAIRLFVLLTSIGLTAPALAEERHVLTGKDVNRPTWDLEGNGWSVHKKTLHGGKQEGVGLITVDNGAMQIDLIPMRGMSIYEVRAGDMTLGWNSPVEEIVHPALMDLESRGGLGWLEGFNEWMVRCGLEFAGHPGTDEFTSNTGETSTMELTLHGKIGNIPASEVAVIVDESDRGRITVRGVVYEKFFNGPKLKLVTELSVVPGEMKFRIDDTVENQGALDQEFQVIYHANFGAPLLEENARVHAAVGSLSPMNDHAAKSLADYSVYKGPTAGFVEEVYLVEPLSDRGGKTLAVLQNAKGDRGASVSWSTKQLPYLTLWKNTAAEEDGYVTGIEPATGYPFNRKIEREAGRVPKLAPGESRRFTLDFGLHRGTEEVQAAINAVMKIQRTQEPVIHQEPPAS